MYDHMTQDEKKNWLKVNKRKIDNAISALREVQDMMWDLPMEHDLIIDAKHELNIVWEEWNKIENLVLEEYS